MRNLWGIVGLGFTQCYVSGGVSLEFWFHMVQLTLIIVFIDKVKGIFTGYKCLF